MNVKNLSNISMRDARGHCHVVHNHLYIASTVHVHSCMQSVECTSSTIWWSKICLWNMLDTMDLSQCAI